MVCLVSIVPSATSVPSLVVTVQEHDEPVLEHLTDIKVVFLDGTGTVSNERQSAV